MGDRVCAGIYPLVSFCEIYSPLHHKQEKVISLPKNNTNIIHKTQRIFINWAADMCVSINYKFSFLTKNVNLVEAGLNLV